MKYVNYIYLSERRPLLFTKKVALVLSFSYLRLNQTYSFSTGVALKQQQEFWLIEYRSENLYISTMI